MLYMRVIGNMVDIKFSVQIHYRFGVKILDKCLIKIYLRFFSFKIIIFLKSLFIKLVLFTIKQSVHVMFQSRNISKTPGSRFAFATTPIPTTIAKL